MKTILAAGALVTGATLSAHAADLMAPAMAPAMTAPVGIADWTGPFVGLHAGYGWLHEELNPATWDMTGPIVGGQVGYSYQLDNGVVVGLQGDLDWANIVGDAAPTYPVDGHVSWSGALTARLGYAVDNFQLYALGGVAFAHNRINSFSGNAEATHAGWTVGVGAEAMLMPSLSAFAEYRYADYGTRTYSGLGDSALTGSTVRAGVNYHF